RQGVRVLLFDSPSMRPPTDRFVYPRCATARIQPRERGRGTERRRRWAAIPIEWHLAAWRLPTGARTRRYPSRLGASSDDNAALASWQGVLLPIAGFANGAIGRLVGVHNR